MSSPKGFSFNDAVVEHDVSLLSMSSAKIFGEALKKAGQWAIFAKQDIQDAYKLIPNPQEQWHLYGFEWLGKFFLDTTTVFGSKAAPASFDPFPETIVNIVCTMGKIPKKQHLPPTRRRPNCLTEGFEIDRTFYNTLCADL